MTTSAAHRQEQNTRRPNIAFLRIGFIGAFAVMLALINLPETVSAVVNPGTLTLVSAASVLLYNLVILLWIADTVQVFTNDEWRKPTSANYSFITFYCLMLAATATWEIVVRTLPAFDPNIVTTMVGLKMSALIAVIAASTYSAVVLWRRARALKQQEATS